MLTEAKQSEKSKRATEITAKRLRIERVELFSRLSQAEKMLRVMLGVFTKSVTDKVIAKGTSLAGLTSINAVLHNEIVMLRRRMKGWFLALVKDSMKMGFRHVGDSLTPIFKHNQEAITNIIAEQALFEAKLSFGLDTTFAKQADPKVDTTSAKWTAIGKKIAKNLTRTNKATGVKISERIWELTARTEMDLKRIIANGIAQGNSPYKIAKNIEKYVSPSVSATDELGIQTGPGIYRSPYRNAMRLARTETSRAYNQASAEFAKDKPWVDAVAITLSPNHDVEDDCDDIADNGPYSPEEAADILPIHPHCMCYLTPIIDPKYLGEDDEDAA